MPIHKTRKDVIDRLKRAHGHLASVIKSIEEDKKCVEVAQQLHAVSNAIIKAKIVYVRDHIDHCLTMEKLDDEEKKREVIDEFKEITKYIS